jgi:DNA-binding NarL/FixJ family response regulator
MIRVVIVEENAFLRFWQKVSVESEGDIEAVEAYDTATLAIAELDTVNPEVVLLSDSTVDMPSHRACGQIVKAAPNARVIILSWEPTPEKVAAAMLSGASGYLAKDVDLNDLTRAVRANSTRRSFQLGNPGERVTKPRSYPGQRPTNLLLV